MKSKNPQNESKYSLKINSTEILSIHHFQYILIKKHEAKIPNHPLKNYLIVLATRFVHKSLMNSRLIEQAL